MSLVCEGCDYLSGKPITTGVTITVFCGWANKEVKVGLANCCLQKTTTRTSREFGLGIACGHNGEAE